MGSKLGFVTVSDDIYLNGQYQKVMGTGVISLMWKFIHATMERPFREMEFEKILELGAGNGEHLPQVKSKYSTYFATDLRLAPLKKLAGVPGLQIAKIDASKINFPDKHFARTIVSCVLAHVITPVKAITEIHRVTEPGGYITIYLPCEPGILLRFTRMLTTVPKNKNLGITDPYYQHYQEHRNYYLSLNHYIKSEYAQDSVRTRYYPFPFLSWNFNLFKIYQIKLKSIQDN